MPAPRAIFFDVMDTLVRDPFHVEMPTFLGMTLPELLRAKHPTAWVDFELGRIDEPTFLSIFLPGHDWDAAGFCAPYLLPCRRLGVAPEEALFVDDRAGNCDAARALGMDSVVFQDAAGLHAELSRRGLLE